jgi:metal-sulfur cluster biosynthetic enzyme
MDRPATLPDIDTLRNALRSVIDPEVGMNIITLGLVYRLAIEDGTVVVEMTMTSPACPLGDLIMDEVDEVLRRHLPEDTPVDLRLVWEPPWSPDRMTAAARRHFES